MLQAYAMLAERLTGAAVSSPQAEAWQLLEAATGQTRARLLMAERSLARQEERVLGEWLSRRELREPLQLILGRSYFYGLELAVQPGVLIPRPETERLVEITLSELHDVSQPVVLDVGTGTGAVALALQSERREAKVMASDMSPAALALSSRNARSLGLELELVESDLLAHPAVARFAQNAHVIVSNPPYLPESDREQVQPEVRWDPAIALFAGNDGLAIFWRLEEEARHLCSPGSKLIVELDPRNVDTAAKRVTGWQRSRVDEDLAGRRRFLVLTR